jgi:hypothetical protein
MLRLDADTVVGDVEPSAAVVADLHVHRHVPADWRVPDAVLDQVGDQLAQAIGASEHRHRLGPPQRNDMLRRDLLEPLDHLAGELVQTHELERPVIGVNVAGEVEQVCHEPAHALGFERGLGGDLLARLLVEIPCQQVQIRSNHRQRVAELV